VIWLITGIGWGYQKFCEFFAAIEIRDTIANEDGQNRLGLSVS
jgi:hypothetical protein